MNLAVAGLLAAFAAGATLLQACPRLPPAPGRCWSSWPAASTVAALFVRRDASHGGRGGGSRRESALIARRCRGRGRRRGRPRPASAYAAWRAQVRLADELPPAWEERDVRVTGIVDDLPQASTRTACVSRSPSSASTRRAPSSRNAFRSPGSRRATAMRCTSATAAHPAPVVHAGERWSLTVRLKRPHGNVNPDGFDLEAWLLERNLRATGYVRDSPANVRLTAFAGRFGDHVQRARERDSDCASPRALPVHRTRAWSRRSPSATSAPSRSRNGRVFNRTGVTHLVSISGLHVTVFATLAGALRADRGPAQHRADVARASAQGRGDRRRAVRVRLRAARGRRSAGGANAADAASLARIRSMARASRHGDAGLAMVARRSCCCGIRGRASRPASGCRSARSACCCMQAAAVWRAPGRARHPRTLREAIRESARAQWVVTLGLVPGTLALFQQVSVVSALANAVAIPVVTLGVVPLALFAIAVPLDAPWQHRARRARAADALSGMDCGAAVGGVGIACAARVDRRRRRSRASCGCSRRAVYRDACSAERGCCPWRCCCPRRCRWRRAHHRARRRPGTRGLRRHRPPRARLRHRPAFQRHGRCRRTHRRAVPARGRRLRASMRSSSATPTTIIRAGALSIIDAMPVAWLMSSLPADHPIVARVRDHATATACVCRRAMGMGRRRLHDPASPIASPMASRRASSNDLSCVLRIESADGSALLTGDIEAAAETELLQSGFPIRSSRTCWSCRITAPVRRRRARSLRQCRRALRSSRPAIATGSGIRESEILARYLRAGAERPRTDLQGAITVALGTGKPLAAEAERDRHRRYWFDATILVARL